MADTFKQRKWRRGTAEASVTVHLSELDAATLDLVARWLYDEFPHDPPEGIENPWIVPSRPAAIRELCRRYRDDHPDAETQIDTMARARKKLSAFYRREASWRRTTAETVGAKKPKPPWR